MACKKKDMNKENIAENTAIKLLNTVLNVTGTGIAIIDRDCNIVFLNDSWKEKYGDYKGKKCYEYFSKMNDICPECGSIEKLKTVKSSIREAYMPGTGRSYQIIKQIFIEEEEPFIAEIFIDITDNKMSEDMVYKFSTIVEQSPSAIVITDTKGRIEYVNQKFTEITGYTIEEVRGKNPSILKSGETTEAEYRILWDTIKIGKEWRGEFHNKNKNGELYWEYASISPIKNAYGITTHYLAIKEDITERKKMEEELRVAKEKAEIASKIKGQFLANMSHELRTPMNSIIGISQMLVFKSSENLTEKQIKGLKLIHESGKRLLELINNILDLSKLEAEKMELDLNEFYLDELLIEIDDFTKSIINEKVKFKIRKSENLPVTIFSDKKKITQILINLLSNAIKFTEAGEIKLEVKLKEDRLYFSIKDTGIGIASENLALIFQEFKQIDGETTKSYKGTGLGLAISQKLISLLKGNISVESIQGKGSVFTFYIPIRIKREVKNGQEG